MDIDERIDSFLTGPTVNGSIGWMPQGAKTYLAINEEAIYGMMCTTPIQDGGAPGHWRSCDFQHLLKLRYQKQTFSEK